MSDKYDQAKAELNYALEHQESISIKKLKRLLDDIESESDRKMQGMKKHIARLEDTITNQRKYLHILTEKQKGCKCER